MAWKDLEFKKFIGFAGFGHLWRYNIRHDGTFQLHEDGSLLIFWFRKSQLPSLPSIKPRRDSLLVHRYNHRRRLKHLAGTDRMGIPSTAQCNNPNKSPFTTVPSLRGLILRLQLCQFMMTHPACPTCRHLCQIRGSDNYQF